MWPVSESYAEIPISHLICPFRVLHLDDKFQAIYLKPYKQGIRF